MNDKNIFPNHIRSYPFPKEAGDPVHVFRDWATLKNHPEVELAKAGDVEAAGRLIKDIISPDVGAHLRERFSGNTYFAAPMALEASGENCIPGVLATYCASLVGGVHAEGIYQVNKVYHTGATAMERLLTRPSIEGDVLENANYVVVDDVTTLGGTIAEVADHIQRGGGKVVGSIVLVDASRTARIRASKKHMKIIEERFGDEIRNQFKIDPSGLTDSEATVLIAYRDVDQLRTRIAKAERERDQRLRSQGVRSHQQRDSDLELGAKKVKPKRSRISALKNKNKARLKDHEQER